MIPAKAIKLSEGCIARLKLQLAIHNSSPKGGDNEPKPLSPELAATLVYTAIMLQKQSPKLLTESETSGIDADRVVDVTNEKKPSTNPFDGMVDPARQKKVSTNPFDAGVAQLVITEEVHVSDEKQESTNPVDEVDENSHYQPTQRKYSPGFDWKPEWTSDGHDLFTTGETTKKGLLERLSQHKAVIAAGSALTVLASGGAAAYFFYPVATVAHIATAVKIGSAAAMGTHLLLIQPGLVNAMLIADVLLKVAVVPAAQVTATIVMPAISTVVISALGAFILLCIANKAWEVSKFALYNVGIFALNIVGKQLDRTMLGRGIKSIAIEIFRTYADLGDLLPRQSTVTSGPKVNLLENTSEEQKKSKSTTGTEFDSEVTDDESEDADRIQAQEKSTSTAKKVLKAGFVTTGFLAAGYLLYNWRQQD